MRTAETVEADAQPRKERNQADKAAGIFSALHYYSSRAINRACVGAWKGGSSIL